MPVHVHVCVRVQWGGGSQKCVSSTCSAAYQLIFPSDPIFFLLSQSLPSFLPSLTLASSLLVTALLSSHPSCSLPHPSSRVKEVACRIQGLSLSACCHGDPEAGPRILGEGRSLKALRRRPGLSFRASEWPPCCQGSVWMTAEECGFWAGRQSAVPQGAWVQTLQTFLGLQESFASVFSSRTSRKLASHSGDEGAMGDSKDDRNPTEVQMSQLVLPCHTNQRGELSVGQLLKWIDTTACLSAERHAGCPCVTASMDDIYFDHTISVGQVVNIKAKVNRAFNSSMEVGIQVTSEDLCSENQWTVCKALATFVAHQQLSKVKLKQITPRTEEEKMEHSVAAERRRMRLVYTDTIKDLLANCTVKDDPEIRDCSRTVPAEKTRVESVELVLPPHANHQGNTFGGQIMAWMENVATIAASRLCRAHPTLKAIEMFHFRGPSQVGDRLVFKAIVNNAFKHSMEVGVCVEAYRQEAEPRWRHINSAFMTFVVLDADDQPQKLPWIQPQPGDGERRYREAQARKKIRLDRRVGWTWGSNPGHAVFLEQPGTGLGPETHAAFRQLACGPLRRPDTQGKDLVAHSRWRQWAAVEPEQPGDSRACVSIGRERQAGWERTCRCAGRECVDSAA
ncbi:acyl-coenzyme A thioesterase 11 isoform X1 [Cavia porcellus]|uniref:acyl-coenzyme A thioesterase 11 isoform X1 n=1 Tax=Cavia porcellus TaxID=10141 RepID=UPI002FDF290C